MLLRVLKNESDYARRTWWVMIIGEDFVWLHLGKTGGKTMRKAVSLIQNQNLIKIVRMPDHHFNISEYELKYNKKISN